MRGKTGCSRACGVLAAVTTVAALAAEAGWGRVRGPTDRRGGAPATASTAAGRLAVGPQPRDWAATLRPGQTRAASTAGPAQGTLSMTRQARAAAAASAATFSGAELAGVSCTGRKQCTATGLASTRTGKNYKPLAERWNGTTWTAQRTPTTNSGGLPGGPPAAGVSCTSSSACMAAGFSYTATKSRLLGEGLERAHLDHPVRLHARGGRGTGRDLLYLGQGLHGGGHPFVGPDPGRALERPALVRRDHQAHGSAHGCVLPRHRELHGRRMEQRREGAGRALEREGLVRRVACRPAAAQPALRGVLPGHQLLRGRWLRRHGVRLGGLDGSSPSSG